MMAVRKIYQKRKVAHNQPFITIAKTTCVERIGYLDNELTTPPQPKETAAAGHGADKNANPTASSGKQQDFPVDES